MLVSESIKKQRLELCESCEHYTKLYICSKCNCFMPVKAALALKACPAGKWDRVVESK